MIPALQIVRPYASSKKQNSQKAGKKMLSPGPHRIDFPPPAGLFNKAAATIARSLASKKVSAKGPGSVMDMLTFYMNRAGHNLSPSRRPELARAKKLLSGRMQQKHVKAA